MIRIGSRESKLAKAQTDEVAGLLESLGYETEKVYFKTTGDKMLDKPLQDFGGKAVFVTEIEDALLSGDIDIAVHSAKDMPAELADGLDVAAALKREDPKDIMLRLSSTEKDSIKVIGTSSLRREVQLRSAFGDAEIKLLRGNVPTRVSKLRNGEYDAIILAKAGLTRLGLMDEEDLVYDVLDTDVSLPAAGQAIIAIESKTGTEAFDVAAKLSDPDSMNELRCEREFMNKIGADCHEAVAAYSRIEDGIIKMDVMKYIDKDTVYYEGSAPLEESKDLADELGERIIEAEEAHRNGEW